ncbi:MAG: hypothetical protein HKN29_14555 [Rhodothermales bacterium]|nr:hypothetical protein [Rhodothermales bacterium]
MLRRLARTLAVLLAVTLPAVASGQSTQGSRNITLDARIPTAAGGPVVAVALDQSRPLAFVAHREGVSIFNTDTHRRATTWRPDAGPIADIAPFGPSGVAIATESEILLAMISDSGQANLEARLSVPGLRSLGAYRHSSGESLVLGAGPQGAVLASAGSIITIPLPEEVPDRERGAYGIYAGYDLATDTDRLYVAGAGGYFVYDITRPAASTLLTWVNSAAVQTGVGIQASPDATQLVTTTNYASAPIRVFDIRPALDGTISQVRTAVGAWSADWRSHAERFEMRWPYVFVAARDQGFQMFNLRNAYEPYTSGWFQTAGPAGAGALDLDVRNSDGLVAVLDSDTGLWLLRVEDFRGWDGRGWGFGNISSVQDWEQGPVNSDRWQP